MKESHNKTIETIYDLRSTRDFNDKRIDDETLSTIINTSLRASNAGGRQGYSVIVVRDREKIKSVFNYDGDTALMFCADYNRIVDTGRHLGYEFTVERTHDFVTGCTDAVMVAQTAAIAAISLGVESFFTNSLHRGDINRIFKEFELPEKHCFPVITVIMGYTDTDPKPRKGRLTKGVVHYDKYHRLTSDEMQELVERYDQEEDPMTHSPWKEKGFKRFLDMFYDDWFNVTEEEVEERVQAIKKVMEDTGFL